MSKTLDIKEGQVEVKCPKCDKEFWAQEKLSAAARIETIYCPACNAPLQPPSINLEDMA